MITHACMHCHGRSATYSLVGAIIDREIRDGEEERRRCIAHPQVGASYVPEFVFCLSVSPMPPHNQCVSWQRGATSNNGNPGEPAVHAVVLGSLRSEHDGHAVWPRSLHGKSCEVLIGEDD